MNTIILRATDPEPEETFLILAGDWQSSMPPFRQHTQPRKINDLLAILSLGNKILILLSLAWLSRVDGQTEKMGSSFVNLVSFFSNEVEKSRGRRSAVS